MDQFDNFEDCLNEQWLPNSTVSNLNNGLNIQINVIDSGAESKSSLPNRFIKWKIPASSRLQNRREDSSSSQWVVTLVVLRPAQVTCMSALVQCTGRDELFKLLSSSCVVNQDVALNIVEEKITISLQQVLDMLTDEIESSLINLILRFDATDYDVCQFEIKELKVDTEISSESGEQHNGSIGIRVKKQMVAGPHKGRCQRLERKDLKFLLKTNIAINELALRGYVKRVNERAMLGKQKAVTGETELPLTFLQNSVLGANDPRMMSYVCSMAVDLDPDQFYCDYPGKELYTSDKTTPENNIFIFQIQISIGNQSFMKEVYRFQTKSKEYPPTKHQHISALELEATRAHIKDLKIEKLSTVKGDIAYSWKLMNADTAGRYEEGDVVGIFPDKTKSNNKTYLDLLTPSNHTEAILAGVITRSYYIAANSQEEDHDNPSEKICMIGKIPIKISGPVKHGDFIYASNKLPGVAVTEEQLCANKGNWREKRLLGYSLESSTKPDVKLVSCVVSILLSINNDQIERLLARLEETLSESFERKIDEFREDVDIRMEGMNRIVNTTQDYLANKKTEISRRTRRTCGLLMFFFVIGIVSSYFFLSPTSPYIKWKCRQGSLPGSVTFEIENRDDEKFVRMEGILFDVVDLRRKIGVDFALNENFNGSYYLNLRKCKRDNLRKVLGWFSNPPVYTRAQVFAVSCNCSEIYHYHQYHQWVEYYPVFDCHCYGRKASQCQQNYN